MRSSTKTLVYAYLATLVVGTVGWSIASLTGLGHWYFALAVMSALALLVTFRKELSPAVSTAIFLSSTAVIMACVSWQTYLVAAAGRWSAVAFAGYKLTALAVAFVAPVPVWGAYLVIALCALNPTVQTLLASSEIRANYPQSEPWVSIVYAMVAFFVLRHRLRENELARKVSALEGERRTIEHVAQIFLGLRDLTNTPLQSITTTAWLLKRGHVTPTEAAEHLDSALVQLRELSEILKTYEHEVDYRPTDHAFDAVKFLQEKLAHMKPPKSD